MTLTMTSRLMRMTLLTFLRPGGPPDSIKPESSHGRGPVLPAPRVSASDSHALWHRYRGRPDRPLDAPDLSGAATGREFARVEAADDAVGRAGSSRDLATQSSDQ